MGLPCRAAGGFGFSGGRGEWVRVPETSRAAGGRRAASWAPIHSWRCEETPFTASRAAGGRRAAGLARLHAVVDEAHDVALLAKVEEELVLSCSQLEV